MVDATAFDYCRVTALVAPRDWESSVDQRQVKLTDFRGKDYDQVLRQKLDEFFEQFETESLLKKTDLLFANASLRRGGLRLDTANLTVSACRNLTKCDMKSCMAQH